MKLNCWNWRYRIFFDDNLSQEVKEFSKRLEKDEMIIYEDIIKFYSSFYSIQILMDIVEEQPQEAGKYIEKAFENVDKIIYLPQLLDENYRKQIAKFELAQDLKEKLFFLVDYAGKGMNIYTKYLELCSCIYGESFEQMLNIVREDNVQMIVSRGGYIESGIVEESEMVYKHSIVNRSLIECFGECAINEYDVKIINGIGFAEWWDRDISGNGKNVLILFENRDSKYENDLKYTMYHEAYPGHGHFYNIFSDRESIMFDHGAMSLIEGWATYAEWNSEKTIYIESVRKNALNFLNIVNTYSGENVADNLFQSKLEQGYSKELALQSVINATQYIGYVESYYYGALWIEHFLQKKRLQPKDFLDILKGRNIVEGFAVWDTIC